MSVSAHKFRLFVVSLIAPCQCRATNSTGNACRWRTVDASRCRRRGHEDETILLGLSPFSRSVRESFAGNADPGTAPLNSRRETSRCEGSGVVRELREQ